MVGHYKVFCDKALEGTIAEPEDATLGAELLAASADSLDGKTTIRIGKNFQGRASRTPTAGGMSGNSFARQCSWSSAMHAGSAVFGSSISKS